MTPFEIIELSLFAVFIIAKCLRNRQKKLEEEVDDSFYNLDLCTKKHSKPTDNNISSFPTLLRPGLQDLFGHSSIQAQQAQMHQEMDFAQQINNAFGQRTGVHEIMTGVGEKNTVFKDCKFYPGKVIYIDPAMKPEEIKKELDKIEAPQEDLFFEYRDGKWRRKEPIYDEEYWRAWRRKHKHEDDPG